MKYEGNSVSEGIAVGEVYLYTPFIPRIQEETIPESQTAEEVAQYQTAKERAKRELDKIKNKLEQEKDEKAKIFSAHLDILFDTVMDEDIIFFITNKKYSSSYAVSSIFDKYAKMLDKVADELIRERAADIRDVKNRLLRNLRGIEEKNLSILEKPAIVVAHDLTPSDTATLDRKNVLAIISETGGETSHTAIIAKSYGIPAVLGVKNMMSVLRQDEKVIVDAVKGEIFTEPSAEQIEYYLEEKQKYAENAKKIKEFISVQPVMQDGHNIGVYLNIGSAKPQELEGSVYVDGVGLFRTEFLFLGKEQLPTEEEQFTIYRKVLTTYGEKPVILRTLDIGGDKTVSYMDLPIEENPFLGNRALRLCFSHPEIFKTQLKAAYRASVYGNLWLMLPMVGSLDDIRKAKVFIEEVKTELRQNAIAYSENVKVGIMIEIPSIALIADKAAKEVDFASFGTNDLCQYLTAVDRMNPQISEYYQSYHPAMFRLMGYATEAFAKLGKPVSVCGELGGDLLAPAVLIGLGINKLSMGIGSVARTKKLITHLSFEKAKKLAAAVKEMSTAAEVEQYLKSELSEILQ
ncbi:MAG: phosphoenolpyruvate--protein phosphotransferase [Clostridiales bacterium]|nr:phosphoenolpyruvate--protein phosphotransferase [Clostridiales bacterium]